MSKSSGPARLGRGSSAIVDVVQRRQADRLAKIAFVVTWPVVGLVVAVLASAITEMWWALLLGAVTGFVVAVLVAVVVFIWPGLRLVWYWAGEITAMVLLLVAYLALTVLLPWPVALALLVVAVAAPLVVPASRRRVLAWGWCAISRHRLRTCFSTFIRANRYGSLPLILWAHPTPAGERVWVWLRPGLSLDDLTSEGGLARLAVGCWAVEVRISPASKRRAALLRVDITRRDSLAQMVTSPLVEQVPDVPQEITDGELAEITGLDLPDIPDVPTTTAVSSTGSRAGSRTNGRTRQSATTTSATTAAADDLSEWI